MTIEANFLTSYGQKYAVKTLKSIQIIEEEGKFPIAILNLDKTEYAFSYGFSFCEVIQDEKLIFQGRVISRNIEDDNFKLNLVIPISTNSSKRQLSNEMLEKFREENPELFTELKVLDYTLKGEIFESDILTPNDPIDITNEMIPPLKLEQNEETPISEINLKLKGSWISRREGNIGISTKIDNHFNMGKVNTLTPKKLLDSWPQFGEKFSGKSRTTKYYVGQSRLRESDVIPFPALKINSEIAAINLNKYVFDNKLSIAWDYDQYMTETGTLKIKNNLIKENGLKPALGVLDQLNLNLTKTEYPDNKKDLYINLKNVQEYVTDPFEQSFFRSDNGNLILNEILKSVVNYILLSMRNLEISFEYLYSEELKGVSCRNWIIFNGIDYKITKLERRINSEDSRMFITAKGFGFNISKKDKSIPALNIDKPKNPVIYAEDIIEDIIVKNDANQQYENLLEYISSLKKANRINFSNYKSLISKFLNDNQTEIQIITKPLKTQHCENKTIDFGEICLSSINP